MMSDYKILSHWTMNGLAHEVNQAIERGYKLVGSVTVSMTDTYSSSKELEAEYLQAVTKDNE